MSILFQNLSPPIPLFEILAGFQILIWQQNTLPAAVCWVGKCRTSVKYYAHWHKQNSLFQKFFLNVNISGKLPVQNLLKHTGFYSPLNPDNLVIHADEHCW